MLDKNEFYHGAAIVRLLEDKNCLQLKKNEIGYIVNDSILIYIKYTTQTHSPWRFYFDNDDVLNLKTYVSEFEKAFVALVCGGDGVCVLPYSEVLNLVGEDQGSIGIWRKYNEQYGVKGTLGKIENKIPRGDWPSTLFK